MEVANQIYRDALARAIAFLMETIYHSEKPLVIRAALFGLEKLAQGNERIALELETLSICCY
jgi:hypothetical protein